jgi:hypothetical protein
VEQLLEEIQQTVHPQKNPLKVQTVLLILSGYNLKQVELLFGGSMTLVQVLLGK